MQPVSVPSIESSSPQFSFVHMRSGFNSETLSLGQLLSGPAEYRIPDYQRPYSWTTKEAEQLLDDLTLARDEAPAPDMTGDGY